jgi:hypothetical protein
VIDLSPSLPGWRVRQNAVFRKRMLLVGRRVRLGDFGPSSLLGKVASGAIMMIGYSERQNMAELASSVRRR